MGNDQTAEPENIKNPFLTIDAAIAALSEETENEDWVISLIESGDYPIKERLPNSNLHIYSNFNVTIDFSEQPEGNIMANENSPSSLYIHNYFIPKGTFKFENDTKVIQYKCVLLKLTAKNIEINHAGDNTFFFDRIANYSIAVKNLIFNNNFVYVKGDSIHKNNYLNAEYVKCTGGTNAKLTGCETAVAYLDLKKVYTEEKIILTAGQATGITYVNLGDFESVNNVSNFMHNGYLTLYINFNNSILKNVKINEQNCGPATITGTINDFNGYLLMLIGAIERTYLLDHFKVSTTTDGQLFRQYGDSSKIVFHDCDILITDKLGVCLEDSDNKRITMTGVNNIRQADNTSVLIEQNAAHTNNKLYIQGKLYTTATDLGIPIEKQLQEF